MSNAEKHRESMGLRAVLGFIVLILIMVPVTIMAEEKPPTYGTGAALAPGEGTRVATSDQGENERPTLSADVAFLSQYVWRGYGLSKDSLVIQPSATAGYKGFSLNLWGNFDTDVYAGPNKGKSKWNETDLTFSYERNFGPVGVGAGYIYYYYPVDIIEDTQEFYLSVGGDVALAPTLTVYWDVDEYPGWYFNLGVSHSFDLPHEITLDLAGSVGYYISKNDSIVDYDHNLNSTTNRYNNFQDGLLSIGLSIPFWKYFTAVPLLAYSFPLCNVAGNMLRAISISNDASHLFGGVTLSMVF
jgi:hypothetical protein